MKIKNVEGKVLLFAQSEINNPHLRPIRFVLADDRPNVNNQAVSVDEFDALAASAVNMPIKMRFLGKKSGAGGHTGAVVIGHINDTEREEVNGTNRLIAQGVLYAFEYKDIVDYLDEALAEEEANPGKSKVPGISWELGYTEGIIEKGIEWLKGVVARAATLVGNPAYGKRTALLALASDQTLTEEQLEEEALKVFAIEQPPEGGTDDVNLEEAQARIAELETELANAKADSTQKATEIETLSATASRVEELETQVTELTDKVSTFEKNDLIADRTEKAVAAGYVLDKDADKLAKKQELWASMAEEIFEEYVSDLAAVAKKVPATFAAQASARKLELPKITTGDGGSAIGTDFRSRIKGMGQSLKPVE
jgi:hypothetical protein